MRQIPSVSSLLAVGLASLTIFLNSIIANMVPSYTPVIAYGPGALLWYLAILSVGYVVARDSGHSFAQKMLPILGATVCLAFAIQVGLRATIANESEQERIPFYAAKRGAICAIEATPLPIVGAQPALALESVNQKWLKQWHSYLGSWGVAAIQIESEEYKLATKGTPNYQRSSYQPPQPISVPARYKLIVDGGDPHITTWSDQIDYVRMRMFDNTTQAQIGELVFLRERNRELGFCPLLSFFRVGRSQEAIQWLAPFIVKP